MLLQRVWLIGRRCPCGRLGWLTLVSSARVILMEVSAEPLASRRPSMFQPTQYTCGWHRERALSAPQEVQGRTGGLACGQVAARLLAVRPDVLAPPLGNGGIRYSGHHISAALLGLSGCVAISWAGRLCKSHLTLILSCARV